jgi:hypothetical protein
MLDGTPIMEALQLQFINDVVMDLSDGRRTFLFDGAFHFEKPYSKRLKRLGIPYDSIDGISLMYGYYSDLAAAGIDYFNASLMKYTGTGLWFFLNGLPEGLTIPTVYYDPADGRMREKVIAHMEHAGASHFVRKNILRHWSRDVSLYGAADANSAIQTASPGHVFQPLIIGPYSDGLAREYRIGVVCGKAVDGRETRGGLRIDRVDPRLEHIIKTRATGAQLLPYEIEADVREVAEQIAHTADLMEGEFRSMMDTAGIRGLDYISVDIIRDAMGRPKVMEAHLRPNLTNPPTLAPLGNAIARSCAGYEKVIIFHHKNELDVRLCDACGQAGVPVDMYQFQ